MKNFVWLIMLISLAAAGTIKIDVDQLRSSDHTKVWTPPSATTTLIGTDTTNSLTNKTLDKLVISASQLNTATTGANAVFPTPTSSMFNFNNASLTSVDGITAPADVFVIVFRNKTGNSVTINNETGVNTTFRIVTGTGAAISLVNDASLLMSYSTTYSRWYIVGGSGSGGGGISSWATATSYLVGNIVIESNKIYKCLTANTSGTFATDLAAVKWVVLSATDLTAATGVLPLANGGTNNTTGTATINAAMTGEATSNGTTNAVTLTNSAVIGKVLTAFASGAGTVSATDSLLTSIQKLDGNNALNFAKSTLTTKGDLAVATAASTIARQSVGTNAQVLVADSTQTNGLKWDDAKILTKSDLDGADVSTIKLQYPNAQLTTTSTGNRLVETGNPNVLPDSSAEAATTPWSAYKDAAGVLPVDGTAGTALYVTCANSASSPLERTKSFLITKSANNAQGEGCSVPFTIPVSSKYKVNRLSFDYAVASGAGTYTDDQVEFFVYDITNSKVIPFTPSKLKNHTLPSERFAPNGEFQASDSTSYQLIAHIAGTSASAYTLKFDSFKLGVYEKTYGSAVTDYVTATSLPSITGTSSGTLSIGTGGGAQYSAIYKRVGDEAIVKYTLRIGTTGTTDVVGGYYFQFPNGLVNSNSTNYDTIGYGDITTIASANPVARLVAKTFGSGFLLDVSDSGNLNGGGLAYNNANILSVTVRFKVVGLSSSQVMSSDADTRVVAWQGYTSSTQAFSSATQITSWTTVKDDVGGFASNSYTIKVPGRYRISGNLLFGTQATANTAGYSIVYKNGSPLANGTKISLNSAINTSSLFTNAFDFIAGDIITIYGAAGLSTSLAGITADQTWSIERLSGPAQIAASESVNVIYSDNSGQVFPATTTANALTFNTREKDSHNAYNSSTGVFTAPMSGAYLLTVMTGVYGTSTTNYVDIMSATTGVSSGSTNRAIGMSGSQLITQISNRTFLLLAGQTISLTKSSTYSAGTVQLFNQASWNNLSITRTGNY